MSDLDIVIKLDPAQPVAGAKAVTAEVAKLETQAKKTESAASGIAKLNFKQAASAAGQAFGLLNEKLKITDSEFGKMASSAMQFGQVGAQIAGPWGAVAGALVGIALEGEGTFEMLERVADSTKTVAERFTQLTKDSTTFNGQLAALTAGSHTLSEAIVLVTRHLGNLQTATAAFSSLGPVLAQVNAQLEAQKKILESIDGPRNAFVLSMTALNMLFTNGKISAADYVTEQARLATGLATHEGVVVKTAKAYAELADNQTRVFNNMAILTAAATRNTVDPRAAGMNENNEFVPTAQEWNIQAQPVASEDAEREIGRQRDMANFRSGQAQAQYDWIKKSKEEAKQLEQTIGSIDSIVKDSLISGAQTFSSALVDAANGADVSWSSTFESILTGLQKAIVQALILKAITGSYTGAMGADGKAVGGLMGLAGFATGGMIMPGGSGGTDSQVVMFRKSPEEAVRIHTPAQEAAFARGPSGPTRGRTTSVNVPVDDSRALLQALDGPDGDRVLINVVRRNPGAFRALLR